MKKIFIPFMLMASIATGTASADTGVNLDVVKYDYSLDSIKKVIDYIPSGSFLQVHLSGDKRYVMDSDLTGRSFYTKEQMSDIVRYANTKGVTVVPDFDIPGHSRGWLSKLEIYHPDLYQSTVTDFDNGTVDYFSKDSQVTVKKMLDEVMEVFGNQTTKRIVIGGDEVVGGTEFQEEFISYMNDISSYVSSKGWKPIMWNDSITASGSSKLNSNVTVAYWQRNPGSATVSEIGKYHNLYNANSWSLYFLPNPKFTDASIVEQSGYIDRMYALNKFYETSYMTYKGKNISGSFLSFWGENTEGMTNEQVLRQELPLIDTYIR